MSKQIEERRNMTKIPHNDEAEVERRLIEVLGEGHNQWNYRPDLKSEEDYGRTCVKRLRKITYQKSGNIRFLIKNLILLKQNYY